MDVNVYKDLHSIVDIREGQPLIERYYNSAAGDARYLTQFPWAGA